MTLGQNDVLVRADDLSLFLTSIFNAAGASLAEARNIANNLVEASLRGHDSHGVVRTARYLEYVDQGYYHFDRKTSIIMDGGHFSLLDGAFGFGQTLGIEATSHGISRCREHGVSLVALRQAGHLGRIGQWAEMACDAGLVSIHFVNVARSALVAPYGSRERRISTAPVAIGIPAKDGRPFVLDFATSSVAEGKLLIAQQGGKPAPDGCVVDGDGCLSNDPAALYGDVPAGSVPDPRKGPGALTTMGMHKGSGLALACELLAGALTGSGATGPGDGAYNGMLSIFVDPNAINDGHDFAGSVQAYIDSIRDSIPIDPDKPVLTPGDPERATRKQRLRDGQPLSQDVWASLVASAAKVGLPESAIPAITPVSNI